MITPVTAEDLDSIMPIEKVSYPTPWSERMFRQELTNPLGVNAAYRDPVLVGYIFAWIIFEDLHFNNVTVAPGARRRGVGEKLLRHILDAGRQRGVRRATLEVRPSNPAAQALYRKLEFEQVAVRENYYSDTGEDALILACRL